LVLGDTIIPWLLGTFLLLALLTLTVTIKAWREIKRSPFFFLRRQAEKRMQTYSLASLCLVLASTVTAGYAWQEPPDETPRVAILTNSKPAKEEIAALFAEVEPAADELTALAETSITDTRLPVASSLDLGIGGFLAGPDSILPDEFDQFAPAVELKDDTSIGQLSFSTELGANYQALEPRRIFAEGQYTLYATFDYADMANGMSWSWVWRHNGSVIDGGNELWNYGDTGPGYIYLNPEEGFQNGEYDLEVWVNGEKFAESSVVMNNAAVSAGN
jgi:hypothetical protein